MVDVTEIVQKVEITQEFQSFIIDNPHNYLVHLFVSTTHDSQPELGYYCQDNDTITVFRTDPVTMIPPEEVFKEQGVLEPLDLATVTVGIAAIMERAASELETSYPKHHAMQRICVLQQHSMPVWSVTVITDTLNMMLLKVDAATGALLSRELQHIMALMKQE